MQQFDEFIQGLVIGKKSVNTIRLYKRCLADLEKRFGLQTVEDLNSITTSKLQEFYLDLSATWKPNSMNSFLRALSVFFKWAVKRYYVTEQHAFFIVDFGGKKFVDVPKVKKAVLSRQESIALIKSADNVQDKFMLALLLTTALRRGELEEIKLSDITGCYVKIRGKGDKERTTKLDETLCTMLNIYLANRDTDSEYLFYGTRGIQTGKLTGTSVNNRVRHWVNVCAEKGEIDPVKAKKITAHRLRGTVLTDVAREYGIYAAQRLAGHESIKTTMIYLEDGDAVTETVIDKRSGIFAEALS